MKNSPKLRFPEFVNDGEWEEKPLSKVGKIITGSTPATANLENYGGSKLFVSPADISDKRYIITTKTTLSEQGFKQTRHIKANSILFVCIGSTIGKVAQNKFDCATNQQINSIVPFDEYSNDFVYSALENSLSRIASLAGNHAVPMINKTLFSSVLISCPLLSEQQKIADCLSSIDGLITAQSQKVEALKEHKKALMQQLFPTDSEKVPKLRFPEFENSGEWEEKTLKEVLIKNSMKNKDEKYSLVQSVSNKHGFINQDEYFENRRVASKDTSNYYVIKKGFFAYNPSRIDVGSLAYKFDDDISIISPLYVSFKANQEKIIDIFLLNWFFSENFINQMIFEGGVRNTLNYENLIQIKIKLPEGINEQKKIADCLSSIDELITSSAKKVETLKEHKKGLMQQLFPSKEVING